PVLPARAIDRVMEDFIGRLLQRTFGDGELQLAHADPHSGWIPSEGTVERKFLRADSCRGAMARGMGSEQVNVTNPYERNRPAFAPSLHPCQLYLRVQLVGRTAWHDFEHWYPEAKDL